MRQAVRTILLVALTGAMCGSVWAQQVYTGGTPGGGLSQNQTDLDPGTISGTVLSSTGELMDKAFVRLLPGNMHLAGPIPANAMFPGMVSASTDGNGTFTLKNVNPGTYQMMAQRNGFVTQYYGAREPGKAGALVTVSEGEEITDLEIVLYPQAVVAGQITDQDGDPIQGVQVSAVQTTYMMGQRRLQQAGTDTTDDQGNYRIPNLAPGRYYVEANPRGGNVLAPPGAAAAPAAEQIDLTTYFPNALRQEDAASVTLAVGQVLQGTNIRLRREPVYSVSGVVVDAATGLPVAGAAVQQIAESADITDIRTMLGNRATSGKDGSFTINNLPTGRYALQVSGNGAVTISSGGGNMIAMRVDGPNGGRQQDKRSGRVEVTIGSQNLENVKLEVSEGNVIQGVVRLDGGDVADYLPDPNQGPPGLPSMVPGKLNLQLMPTAGMGQTYFANFQDNGSFTIDGVTPGRYFALLNPGSSKEIYVKAVLLGGQDITNAPVDLLAGGGDLEIVLAKGAAKLSGTLFGEDGAALPGRQVSVWPKVLNLGRSDSGVKTATTDQNGAFEISGMVPGEYYAIAWDSLPEDGLASYPGFLHPFESAAEEVKLGESADGSAQVSLVSAEAAAKALAELP